VSPDLDALIDFINFTHEIRRIRREIILEDDYHENDAEHQFQMALVALFIIDANRLKLDRYRCMTLALVHDIIEVYSGDLIVFAPQKDIDAKLLREAEAVKQLQANWPKMPSLHELIAEYEAGKTREAKFVFALDGLIPEINNYLFGGKAWHKHGITFEQVKDIKRNKVGVDPIINHYHKQVLKLMEAKPEIFAENDK
jgi:putative hydrolases of HD superfamily